MSKYHAAFSLLVFSCVAHSATLVGARYSGSTTGLVIAPGQFARLEVTGLTTVLPQGNRFQQASTVPLPTTLAGISVMVTQAVPKGQVSMPAAMLSVEQVNSCADQSTSSPDCFITFLMVQIPNELSYNIGHAPATEITVAEGGAQSAAFAVGAVTDNFHVITSCDKGAQGICQSVVTHADGTLVSSQDPAGPGEVVVIYAWGLGGTLPFVPTGAVTPTPAPTTAIPGYNGVGVQLDFTPNAAAFRAVQFDLVAAYLTPGQVGLYQVNVQLPSAFPDLQACYDYTVLSNLTINLLGLMSFDAAQVCVADDQGLRPLRRGRGPK